MELYMPETHQAPATTPAHAPAAHDKPVVDPVHMPKLSMDKHKLATINAWAIALAIFLGYCAIFAAIAGFTKKWGFSIPFFGRFMGTNAAVPTALLTALFSVVFAIFGFVTLGKVTDAEATKKAWGCISKVFLGFMLVYAVDMIAIIIYSLMSLGRKEYEFNQGNLWLSSFLSTVVCCIGASIVWFMGKQIAAGKTSLLRIASFIAAGLAAVGFIIVFVQLLVSYYGKSNSSYDSYKDAIDSYSDVLNLLK
jgi:hypothetical protein